MPTPIGYASHATTTQSDKISRDVNGYVTELPWQPRVVAKVASYALLVKDMSTIFTTRGNAGALTFTLPSAAIMTAAGISTAWVEFYNCVDQNMIVAATATHVCVRHPH